MISLDNIHSSADNTASDKPCVKKQPVTAVVHKQSWWGCGKHVPAVLDSTQPAQRCTCEPPITRDEHTYPPMAHDPGWLIRTLADGVLWTRGKKAGYSPEGVVEVERKAE